MADQVPSSTTGRPSSDAEPLTSGPSGAKLVRHDTTSSIGSAKPIPTGHWRFNISGNCPVCHHHHNSIKVRVRASSDSNHAGDVRCETCQRLWLGFGKRNSTRISLLSTKTMEPDPSEKLFHSTIVQMIRPATTVAMLAPTLAGIPESSSAGPSRETASRTTARRGVWQTSEPVASNGFTGPARSPDSTARVQDPISSTSSSAQRSTTALSRSHAPRTSQLGLRKRIIEKLPMLQTSRLGQWMTSDEKLSSKRRGKLPVHESQISPNVLALHTVPAPCVEDQVQTDHSPETKHNEVDVCATSTTAAEALERLKTLNPEIIRAMTPQERIEWMRGQHTAFKQYKKLPVMANMGIQVDPAELPPDPSAPPTRRHSLAFLGYNFGPYQSWDHFRGSSATLNRRSFNISETHLSEADTVVEGGSVTSAPRHILIESLQRDRRGSGSPRPRSFQGDVQSWQQIRQNRAEARRSFDSAATGGAVRSITTTRGRAANRLSRASMGRASTIYNTEPSMSQTQLPLSTNEESEQSSDQEHRDSPSPSRPMSG